jgi:hypothetical protein
MQDPTEQIRSERMAQLAFEAPARSELEARYGQVWNTLEQLKPGKRAALPQ